MTISDTDKQILQILQADATLPLKDLAEKVGVSTSTLWRRIQDMDAAGLILGRVTVLDPEKLGLEVCVLVHVIMKDHSQDNRRSFESFVKTHTNVMSCHAVTGGHDYTLFVRTSTVRAFEDFLMQELLARPEVSTASSNFTLREVKNATAFPL